MPVTRIEFGQIKGRGDGQRKDNYETVLGVFRFIFNTTRTTVRSRYRFHSGQMGWTRRETCTGLWSGSLTAISEVVDRRRWVDPDSFTQRTEQPAGRKRRAGGRPAINRIPEETVVHRDSRWDIPRKRALFTSDWPDSTTSGSDILENHADRPSEVEYSERLISRRPQDEGGTERLCSPNMELEMVVIQLQKDGHVGQEMLTLSGTPDLTPTGVHIRFLPWVRSANFVCPWTIPYGC